MPIVNYLKQCKKSNGNDKRYEKYLRINLTVVEDIYNANYETLMKLKTS
jgi:hypothetical protein